jgi:hypothetical protein
MRVTEIAAADRAIDPPRTSRDPSGAGVRGLSVSERKTCAAPRIMNRVDESKAQMSTALMIVSVGGQRFLTATNQGFVLATIAVGGRAIMAAIRVPRQKMRTRTASSARTFRSPEAPNAARIITFRHTIQNLSSGDIRTASRSIPYRAKRATNSVIQGGTLGNREWTSTPTAVNSAMAASRMASQPLQAPRKVTVTPRADSLPDAAALSLMMANAKTLAREYAAMTVEFCVCKPGPGPRNTAAPIALPMARNSTSRQERSLWIGGRMSVLAVMSKVE